MASLPPFLASLSGLLRSKPNYSVPDYSSSGSSLVKLREFERKFKASHPNFWIYEGRRHHDLFSHILGGGITTPKGEVFGELIEFVLSTIQEESFHPQEGKKPNLTLPTKKAFLEQVASLENRYDSNGQMTLGEHLLEQEIDELFEYATSLLSKYIQGWGVRKGEGLFGTMGYKGYSPSMRIYVDKTL